MQSAEVVADPLAATFAATTEFRAPTYGLDDQLLQQDAGLIGAIQSSSGLAPDAFTLAAYDALHVAALTYAEVGLDSLTDYRAAVLSQAAAYSGATGFTTLNANGDRARSSAAEQRHAAEGAVLKKVMEPSHHMKRPAGKDGVAADQ